MKNMAIRSLTTLMIICGASQAFAWGAVVSEVECKSEKTNLKFEMIVSQPDGFYFSESKINGLEAVDLKNNSPVGSYNYPTRFTMATKDRSVRVGVIVREGTLSPFMENLAVEMYVKHANSKTEVKEVGICNVLERL